MKLNLQMELNKRIELILRIELFLEVQLQVRFEFCRVNALEVIQLTARLPGQHTNNVVNAKRRHTYSLFLNSYIVTLYISSVFSKLVCVSLILNTNNDSALTYTILPIKVTAIRVLGFVLASYCIDPLLKLYSLNAYIAYFCA